MSLKYLKPSQIKVGNRLRQDLGDIQSLADSIEEVGLLHPIVVDEKYILVAGRRRLAAVNLLEWEKVECNVIDIDDTKIGEVHENQSRKSFTASEIAEIADYVESKKKPGRPEKGAESAPLGKGKTREVAAEIVGVSHNTVDKIRTIVQAARDNPTKYGKILEKVDKGTLSVNSAAVLVTRESRNLPKAPLPKGIWSVVQCDFARKFNNSGVRGASDNNYDTMTLEEIVSGIINGEDVRKLFAEDCVIFGWFQASTIFDAKEIYQSWGFEPVTNFVWDKTIPSTGTWIDNYHEHLVIGRKGDIPVPAERIKSIIQQKPMSRLHSSKPPIFYDLIEKQLYPKREYLDLFSRYKHNEHWTPFGNQLEVITA